MWMSSPPSWTSDGLPSQFSCSERKDISMSSAQRATLVGIVHISFRRQLPACIRDSNQCLRLPQQMQRAFAQRPGSAVQLPTRHTARDDSNGRDLQG